MDGLNDIVEAGGIDTNEDGLDDTPNASFADSLTDIVDGGNGTADVLEPNNPNLAGILDLDGNGMIDAPEDADGDGISDATDASPNSFADAPMVDTDNDGIADVHDIDDDNDGIPDVVEENGIVGRDTDGDGIPDSQDLDADGDGIFDIQEVGGTDANQDGKADDGVDTDNDGLADVVDSSPQSVNSPVNTAEGIAATSLSITDTDGSGTLDFQDAGSGGIFNPKDATVDPETPEAKKIPTLSEWMIMMMSMLLMFVGLKEGKKVEEKKDKKGREF